MEVRITKGKTLETWETEPSYLTWKDPATYFVCEIKRVPTLLHLCGYVLLPDWHPWFGQSDSELPVDCHGGLTYANNSDDKWCIGFDCAHSGDYTPGIKGSFASKSSYKDIAYVQSECTSIAWQAFNAINIKRMPPL